MGFDALFCRAVANELKNSIIGAKVEKVHRPYPAELDLVIFNRTVETSENERTVSRSRKCLIISASMTAPRVSLCDTDREHQKDPDAFCMLMRKHLQLSRITGVEAIENERIIRFTFESFNELGYSSTKYLYAEIMGKYSNIILTESDGIVIGALYQSDVTSLARRIMNRLPYEPPPKQNKISPFSIDRDGFITLMKENIGKRGDKALLDTFLSFSPLITREINHRATGAVDSTVKEDDLTRLYDCFTSVIGDVSSMKFVPVIVYDDKGNAVEYSFTDITQYGPSYRRELKSDFSSLLNEFYEDKSKAERASARSRDLIKLLKNVSARLYKKLEAQKSDLRECEKKEEAKRCGDLIIANIYLLKQGMESADLTDYATGETVTVKLDKSLTPSNNAKQYYKKYSKYKRAEIHLADQIMATEEEIEYIESVMDLITRLLTEDDFEDLRKELAGQGYIRLTRKNDKRMVSKPLEFTTSSGFRVRVGKNNLQNDRLTFSADKTDIWFHVKGYPGSHTVLYTEGKKVPDADLTEAAEIAAMHSKAAGGHNIAVDYTYVKYVKKPSGSKPGFVIYDKYSTAYVL